MRVERVVLQSVPQADLLLASFQVLCGIIHNWRIFRYLYYYRNCLARINETSLGIRNFELNIRLYM
jgi:hypothetical protein